MNSIDRYDYEASSEKEKKQYRFSINFKMIHYVAQELIDDNGIRDEHYPKDIFLSMLAGIWVGLTVLFFISKSILMIVSLPFIFFYMMAFFKVYQAWKEYKYKKGQFWLLSILGLILALAVGVGLQILLWK